MHLLNLPEEILAQILKLLDTVSIYNFYYTCSRTRSIIRMYGVKQCKMTHNILASAHILNSVFFKDVSKYIQDLNLSAVRNLTKTILVPTAKRLKRLHTINLGYTNITICDFLEVYQYCPTIKNVTMNFIFDKKNLNSKVSPAILSKCQEIFKDFQSVHFIGSQNNLIYNKIVPFILKKAKDINLQFTVLYDTKMSYNNFIAEPVKLSFNKLYIYFSANSWKYACTNFLCDTLYIQEENLNACECIFILKSTPLTTEYIEIYCSALFEDFFATNFLIEARPVNEYKRSTVHNALFLFWRKEKTIFDDSFFKKLLGCLKPYFPYYFDSSSSDPIPVNYDWFQTSCMAPQEDDSSSSVAEPTFKKARVGQSNLLLEYDNVFKGRDKIELSICFHGLKLNPRTLSPTSNYLTKLTYLNLKGKVQYSGEFFNVLFRCCDKLVTFDFDAPALQFVKSVARSLPLSKSIRNLRLVTKDMDFKTMISSFSQCSVLENVHLIDLSDDCFEITDPLIMFEKCVHLYCFHIYAPVSDNKRNKQMQLLSKAKMKSRKQHLSVNIINSEHYSLENNPFIEVFKFIITQPFAM